MKAKLLKFLYGSLQEDDDDDDDEDEEDLFISHFLCFFDVWMTIARNAPCSPVARAFATGLLPFGIFFFMIDNFIQK